MALGVVAAATTLAPGAFAAPAHESRALPKLVAGSYSGIKPRAVFFSGDAGNVVTMIKWSRWTPTVAVGHGTSNIQGCVPNCAQGSETPVSTSITLSNPRAGHFTKVVEVRDGHTEVGHYGHPVGWPEGAQQ
jgi:hypothetical protein